MCVCSRRLYVGENFAPCLVLLQSIKLKVCLTLSRKGVSFGHEVGLYNCSVNWFRVQQRSVSRRNWRWYSCLFLRIPVLRMKIMTIVMDKQMLIKYMTYRVSENAALC
jgi:hypothetical protein